MIPFFKPLAIAALITGAAAAFAQTYPVKPVTIIAPTNVGSGPDLLARMIGAKLAERWNQQVIIVNKLGAGTMIGTAEVAKSAPDGYSLVLVPDAFANIPALLKVPFDPVKDLAPVTQVALGAMVLCVHPSMPVKTVGEFVDYVKQNPKKVAYGSAGNGTTHHMFMAKFAYLAGLDMVHVPYGGGPGQMQNDLIEGRLNAAFLASNGAIPLVNAGRLRALAVGSEKRMSYWPEVPTFAERGYPAFDLELWYGLLAPGGTPRPVLDKIAADVTWALGQADVRERLSRMGMEAAPNGPDAFTKFVHGELERKKKLAADAGIKAE
jgi:tripartite-type tricarboxylate transporter receptor subunit TctC